MSGSLAQSVEQRTVNPCVAGSSPARAVNKKAHLLGELFYFRSVLLAREARIFCFAKKRKNSGMRELVAAQKKRKNSKLLDLVARGGRVFFVGFYPFHADNIRVILYIFERNGKNVFWPEGGV